MIQISVIESGLTELTKETRSLLLDDLDDLRPELKCASGSVSIWRRVCHWPLCLITRGSCVRGETMHHEKKTTHSMVGGKGS